MPDSTDRRFATELFVDAAPDAVWDAIATARGLLRWFPLAAEVDLRPGGELVWSWGGLHAWRHTIEAVEPGRRLATRYDSTVDDAAGGKVPLFVEFELRPEAGGGTTLRLVQSGFLDGDDFDEEYDAIARGWPVELLSLKLALERHPGRDRRVAHRTSRPAMDAATAWRRLAATAHLAEDPRTGGAFRLTLPDGPTFEGELLRRAEHELAGVAHSHDAGFVRLSIEPLVGAPTAWLWFASWTHDQPTVDAVAAGFDRWVERAFDGSAPA